MTENPIILFDGVCNFCNASVNFVLRHDRNERFKFCSIQSDKGQALMAQYGLQDSGLSSMILLHGGRAYRKSGAALRITGMLDFPWPLLYSAIVIPATLRDQVYDFIGAHRYTWFGKSASCRVPDGAHKRRFLDLE